MMVQEIFITAFGGDAAEHYRELANHDNPHAAAFGRLMAELMPILVRWLDEQVDERVPVPIMIQQAANIGTTVGATMMLNSVHMRDVKRGWALFRRHMEEGLERGEQSIAFMRANPEGSA